MKTQTVFKIVITPDEKAVIHTRDYGFYQIQDIDNFVRSSEGLVNG